MAIISHNPATGEILKEFPPLSSDELQQKLLKSRQAYLSWKGLNYSTRAERLRKVAILLKERKTEYAKLISLEMGRPAHIAISEIEKSVWGLEYYAEKAEQFLTPKLIATEASKSYVRFDPLGIILLVMPWNFPFWQVLRQAAPTLMAGNTVVLKHASNVPQCSLAIEQLFLDGGLPPDVFQSLLIDSDQVETVLQDFNVKGVSLTGSEYAGSQVASVAGREIKTSVMELGGNDPTIILADVDLKEACEITSNSRMLNNGQTCNCVKRFLIQEDIYEEFLELQKQKFASMKVGDPLDDATDLGPLASEKSLEEVDRQVRESVSAGAKVVIGGMRMERTGAYYHPTILSDVKPGMPAYYEEIFGPVASVIKFRDYEEAINIANDTRYGLSSSIWTKDIALAETIAPRLNFGSVFINAMVSSDPRLPFGGVNKAGYGRELGEYGIKEFTNIKTVWVR